MVKVRFLFPKNPPKLASFQRKLESRKLIGKAYFMTLVLFLLSFSCKAVLQRGYWTTKKTFPLKGLDSSVRWNDASVGDLGARRQLILIPNFRYLKQKLDGFSLLEASIVLTIIGLISVVGLGALKGWRQQQKMAITQNHQEQILTAVALYGVRTGHFPYPADPRASMDTFGLSKTPEGEPKDQIGILPYRTLGLPEGVAKDGHGRYFTYIGGSAGPIICASEPAFPLSMRHRAPNGSLQLINTSSEEDPIVIILISHGINGYGAWEGAMGNIHQKLSGVHGPDECENARATQSFISASLSYETKSYNDDHVLWITRNHLLAMYAKTVCKPPERPFV